MLIVLDFSSKFWEYIFFNDSDGVALAGGKVYIRISQPDGFRFRSGEVVYMFSELFLY